MIDSASSVVIRADRWKAGKMFAVSAVITAAGVFSVVVGKDVLLAVIGVLFFGGIAVQNLFTLIRPPELIVEGDGLRWRGLQSWRVAWSDVERFRLMAMRRSSLVLIDYRTDRRPSGAWGRFRQPKAVPSILWMRPMELQELLQQHLEASRAADPSPSPRTAGVPDAFPQPTIVFPWVSAGLIFVLVLVFAAEIWLPITPTGKALQPSVMTLAGFGGLSRGLLTDAGQWYRFVAAPFLHGSLPHLASNAVALFLAGRLLEGTVGRAWFAGIYAFGALAGGLGSLLLNAAGTVSVGASGAIVALFAATYVCSFHFQRSAGRLRLQSGAFAILIPTLLTLGKTAEGATIDVGAHLGGAVGGALLGLVLLRTWDSRSLEPPRQRLGVALAVLGGVAVVGAVWPALSRHVVFERLAALVPDDVMPKDTKVIIDQAPTLLARFPADPRLHLAMALGAIAKGDAVAADREARDGLRNADVLHAVTPDIEGSLWLVQGEAAAQQGDEHAASDDYDKAAAAGVALSALHYDRAELNFHRGALDPALDDATRFAQESPATPAGWGLLGDIQFARSDLPAALTAYDKALGIRISASQARVRGLVRFYAGDDRGALDDLQKASAAEPKNLYGALWLDMARRRQDLPPSLIDERPLQDNGDWPAPLVRMFVGTSDPAAILATAKADVPKPGEDHLCEADFYVAEWDRLHGRTSEATYGFRKAVGECPPTFVETWMARAELKLPDAAK